MCERFVGCPGRQTELVTLAVGELAVRTLLVATMELEDAKSGGATSLERPSLIRAELKEATNQVDDQEHDHACRHLHGQEAHSDSG